MPEIIKYPQYFFMSPSGELLMDKDDNLCLGAYCTCPFLKVHWTGEFNPGKVTACSPYTGQNPHIIE